MNKYWLLAALVGGCTTTDCQPIKICEEMYDPPLYNNCTGFDCVEKLERLNCKKWTIIPYKDSLNDK